MKFCEAMDKLKGGSKVTRQPWQGSVYFIIQDGDVKAMQPKLLPFAYSEDIMVSDGWEIVGSEEEYTFCDVIPLLQKGEKAKLKEWVNTYIYLDPSNKMLVIHSMDVQPFIPDFDSFIAQDWIEL